MDPDLNQSWQGDSHDDNIEHRTADVDDSAVHALASSSVGSTSRSSVDGLLLSDRESWNFRQTSLSDGNGPSNDEDDPELVELTLLCAHYLEDLRCLGSVNPRAELYIDKAFTVHTLIICNGGTNPHWNHKFWFRIDDECFQIGHLSIEIYDRSDLGEDLLIGTARMPMSDLSSSNWVKECFSYQVQVPSSGHFRGVVHVLVRRIRKVMVQMAHPVIHEPWKIFKAGCLEFLYPQGRSEMQDSE